MKESLSRRARADLMGMTWCVNHKCMMLPASYGEWLCPFCWAEDHPDHACTAGSLCHACLSRKAVADGTAPWMTEHGKRQYAEAFA